MGCGITTIMIIGLFMHYQQRRPFPKQCSKLIMPFMFVSEQEGVRFFSSFPLVRIIYFSDDGVQKRIYATSCHTTSRSSERLRILYQTEN